MPTDREPNQKGKIERPDLWLQDMIVRTYPGLRTVDQVKKVLFYEVRSYNDLRHDFATLLINKGKASLYQVQLTLSHDDPRQTQRYAKLLPENLDVVDRIDGEGTASYLLDSAKNYDNSATVEAEGKVAKAVNL
jgi:hypothetical protein